jgi:hypothetical protein
MRTSRGTILLALEFRKVPRLVLIWAYSPSDRDCALRGSGLNTVKIARRQIHGARAFFINVPI